MRKIAYFCILGILAASAAGCQSVSEAIQNNGAATPAAESSAASMTVSTSDAEYTATPASVSATTAAATVQASSSAAAAETPAVTAPSSDVASQEHATTAAAPSSEVSHLPDPGSPAGDADVTQSSLHDPGLPAGDADVTEASFLIRAYRQAMLMHHKEACHFARNFANHLSRKERRAACVCIVIEISVIDCC